MIGTYFNLHEERPPCNQSTFFKSLFDISLLLKPLFKTLPGTSEPVKVTYLKKRNLFSF